MAKIGFVSLGCPKALVDSEQILSRLKALGYETSPSYEEAELVIVNTCGFINEAVEDGKRRRAQLAVDAAALG